MYLVFLGLIIIGFSLFLFVKNNNTYKKHITIISAIGRWGRDSDWVDHDVFMLMIYSIEPYWKTLFRVTDWGLKNILPKKYYEMIEPYIEVETTK